MAQFPSDSIFTLLPMTPLTPVISMTPILPSLVPQNNADKLEDSESIKANVIAPEAIYEDLAILKVLACVPILGSLISIVTGFALDKKIEVSAWAYPRKMRLLNIFFEYKISSIIRNVFNLALAITAIALGIFSLPAMIALCVVLGSLTLYHGYQLSKTKFELEANSFFYESHISRFAAPPYVIINELK